MSFKDLSILSFKQKKMKNGEVLFVSYDFGDIKYLRL